MLRPSCRPVHSPGASRGTPRNQGVLVARRVCRARDRVDVAARGACSRHGYRTIPAIRSEHLAALVERARGPVHAAWWSPPIFFPMAGALALSEHLAGIGRSSRRRCNGSGQSARGLQRRLHPVVRVIRFLRIFPRTSACSCRSRLPGGPGRGGARRWSRLRLRAVSRRATGSPPGAHLAVDAACAPRDARLRRGRQTAMARPASRRRGSSRRCRTATTCCSSPC